MKLFRYRCRAKVKRLSLSFERRNTKNLLNAAKRNNAFVVDDEGIMISQQDFPGA
jgi:hypothetical protein